MQKKQVPRFAHKNIALYYATFNSELLSTDLQQDIREIKEAGFGVLVLRDIPTEATETDITKRADHVIRFAQIVQKNGLMCRIDLAAYAMKDGIDASRADTLTTFMRACSTAGSTLSGIDIPWPTAPAFSADGIDPEAIIPTESSTAVADADARSAATTILTQERSTLEKIGQELFSAEFTVRYYGSPQPINALNTNFTPQNAATEIREIGHVEYLERRPAAPMVNFKMASSFAQASGVMQPPAIIWGEDYGTVRANHSAEIISYAADVASIFNITWHGWLYVRENQHFYRLIRKGVSYPYHPSWKRFGMLLQKATFMQQVLGNARSVGTLALIYPAATINAYTGDARDTLEKSFTTLAYQLLRAGYQFDILPDDSLTRSVYNEGSITMNGKKYTEMVYPFPGVIPHNGWKNLEKFIASGASCILMGMPPAHTTTGKEILEEFEDLMDIKISREIIPAVRMTILKRLTEHHPEIEGGWKRSVWRCSGPSLPITADQSQVAAKHENALFVGLQPSVFCMEALSELLTLAEITTSVTMPDTALLNLMFEDSDIVFALCPAEFGMVINGHVTYKNITFKVTNCTEAIAVRINIETKEVVSHAISGETEIQVEQDIN